MQKNKSNKNDLQSIKEISKFLAAQQPGSDQIEHAMYIQIEEHQTEKKKDERKMKLVKQKNDSKSPVPRKVNANEVNISDVSDIEPAPNTGANLFRFNLKLETLEDILDRIQN